MNRHSELIIELKMKLDLLQTSFRLQLGLQRQSLYRAGGDPHPAVR